MKYCLVENGVIINIVEFDNDDIAKKFGALPSYDEVNMGDKYDESKVKTPNTVDTPEMASAKLKALSDRQDFLEDCIAEMATQVYS